MKTVTGTVVVAGVVADLFAGTGGLIVGAVVVLVVVLAAVAIFRDPEPAERLIDLVRGRAPRDPPSTTSPTRTSRRSRPPT